MQYAVVDVETTGVFPSRDRIVEIAIVNLSEDCTVIDEYTTLVNPQRDVGPTRIHGIEAGHVRDAPTFSDVAGDVAGRLQNRVFVGHNARFDEDFLREEFRRAGVGMSATVRLCTLRMAYTLEPDVTSRKLQDCCTRAGVAGGTWHSALDDALATARLFDAFVMRAQREACATICEELRVASLFPQDAWLRLPPPSGRQLHRKEARARTRARRHYLGQVVQGMAGDEAPTAEEACYLQLLDQVLSDRTIEPEEGEQLLLEAQRLGLTNSHVFACHHLYVRALLRRALEDGVVTEAERKDIFLVSAVLGVSRDVADLMLQEIPRSGATADSLAGKVVCFTGEMSVSREEATQRAEAKGVLVVDSLTKKVNFLVAADADSMSGKAEKARRYGIPILTPDAFWTRLA